LEVEDEEAGKLRDLLVRHNYYSDSFFINTKKTHCSLAQFLKG